MEGPLYKDSPWGLRAERTITFIWIAQKRGVPKDVYLPIARAILNEAPTIPELIAASEVAPFSDQPRDWYEFTSLRMGWIYLAPTPGGWARGALYDTCRVCRRPCTYPSDCRTCRLKEAKKK